MLSLHIVLGLICVSLLVGVYYLLPKIFGWKKIDIHKEIIEAEINIEEIRKINKLVTASYFERQLFEKTKDQYGIFGKSTYKLAAIISGTVKAGFDLSKVKGNDIWVEDGTVFVSLPKPEIVSINIEQKNVNIVFEEKQGVFTNEDIERLINSAKYDLERHFEEQGVMNKAREKGVREVENLFKTLGFKNVVVSVK